MNLRNVSGPALAVVLVVLAALSSPIDAAPARSVVAKRDLPSRRAKLTLEDLVRQRRLWVPGQLVVRFKESVSRTEANRLTSAHGAKVVDHIGALDVSVIDLPDSQTVVEAAAEYQRNPAVAHAEPNKLVYPSAVPDDTRFVDLWGLNNTGQEHRITDPPPARASGTADADADVTEAWDVQVGTPDVVVAVIDTGVDVDHPDLDASIWTNPGEIPDNDIDDDNNGHVDDVNGWDFAEDDDTLIEEDPTISFTEHGTHIAGTIAAEMHNARGVAGVCPGCKIMVLKFMKPFDTNGDLQPDAMGGTLGAELKALDYAREQGADIMNGSFGSFRWSLTERRAFHELGDSGVLSVLIAGNSSLDNDMRLVYELPNGALGFSPEYPASYNLPRILSVAASNHKDQYGYFTGCDEAIARWRCAFTSWGHDSVDVAAPGVDILSTVPDNSYALLNGTSQAAPFAASVAGLVKSHNPLYGPIQIKNAIMNSVDKRDSLKRMPAFRGGPATGKFIRSSGRVNALDALSGSTDEASPLSDGNIDGAVEINKLRRGNVKWPADTNDVFKRWFKKGRDYRVVLDGPRRKDFDLIVWRPKTREIWQIESGCGPGAPGGCKLLRYAQRRDKTKADETVNFTARRSGKYYLQVSAYLFNGGDYTLKVSRT